MPIYVLGPRNPSVVIPNQALTVSISGALQSASLVVHAGDEQVMQPNSHLAVLPQVNGPVSVAVVPAAGADRFAAGTGVSLAIGHDSASDLDPVQVLFDPVDVSGDSSVELARLTAEGTNVKVTATAGADIPLSPPASAARASARKAVAHQRASSGPVLVALDTSASMLPVFAGGGAAVERGRPLVTAAGKRRFHRRLHRLPDTNCLAAIRCSGVLRCAGTRYALCPHPHPAPTSTSRGPRRAHSVRAG
jgi:hypothetical protein